MKLPRREFVALVGGAAVGWPLAARAQQGALRQIGVLMATTEIDPEGQARIAAFTKGLRDVGLIDGRNLRIDYRWAGNDLERIRAFATELVTNTPDVVLAGSTPTLAALRQATRTIPIVFVLVSDPVGQGFVESLAHPGANITGFTNFEFSMVSKWVEMLRETAPNVQRIAMIFNPETAPYAQYYLQPFEAAAQSFAVAAITSPVRSDAEIESAMTALGRAPGGGIIVMPDSFTLIHRDVIISLAERYRLPAIYPFRYFATTGGLLSYGSDTLDLFRRSAAYVDRILKGDRPGDLPVQQPTKFELVINVKTARALGIEVPSSLLSIADEVIE
jgi:putative tryptophan/tyrosine transport system substrate-binding protein